MTPRTGWWMLGVSLAAGAAATLLASAWLGSGGSAGVRSVVVAGRDIGAGQVIDPALLETVSWPRSSLPPGAIAQPSELSGRVVKTALVRGEPVLTGKLAPEGSQGGLAAVISPGNRAITVRVNEVVGVAGFALPGNFVDVLVSAQDDGERSQMVSRIVLERILVLAVAQESAREETRPRVVSAVTLEVTPDQAERLDLARNVGQLSLVLRNQGDASSNSGRGVSRAELLGQARASRLTSEVREARPQPAPVRASASPPSRPPVAVTVTDPALSAAPGPRVEVIRGVLKSTAEFEPQEMLRDR